MQDTQQMLKTGALVRERYRVKSLIGRGNSSAVYLVEDQRGQRVFALKEILGLSKQERVQLTFNSVALRKISHPALPGIHHVFNDDRHKRLCIVMEYVDGPDLETMYQHQAAQRFTWPGVRELLAPIIDAIVYLHRQTPPILHGDIKPINLVLAQSEKRLMLVDIGVVREGVSESSAVDQLTGYKAPEQYGKSVDGRADIYGLGATCYTLLTGIVPPNALERVAQLDRGQADLLKPAEAVAPSMPAHVARALHRSLSIDASERFATVAEFWQAMQTPVETAAQEPGPVAREALPPVPATPMPSKRVDSAPGNIPYTPIPAFLEQLRPFAGRFLAMRQKLVALGLVILILLAGAGVGIWSLAQTQHSPVTSARQATQATPATAAPTRSSTVSVVTPTSSPGSYPSIVGSYAGTIVDISITSNGSPMILQNIHQVGGAIDGYFTAGSPIGISGPFTGTIDHASTIQFIVRDAANQPILFMEGFIQSAGYLSGNFYRCAAPSAPGASCTRAATGSGIWTAKLVPAGG